MSSENLHMMPIVTAVATLSVPSPGTPGEG